MVAGSFGAHWVHANERGGAVLRGKSGLRTVCGFTVTVPGWHVHLVFRRRELKL